MSLLLRSTLLLSVVSLLIGCGDSGDGAAPNTSTEQNATAETSLGGQESEPPPPIVPDEERGFESPEAAYAACEKARKEDDFSTYTGSLTLASQKALAGGTIFGLGMMGALDESLKDAVTALFKKHGLDEQNAMGSRPAGITADSTRIEQMAAMGSFFDNPAAFIVDARNFIAKQPNSNSSSTQETGEIGEIIVDGDSAAATIRHRRGRKRIEFRRTVAGWLVHLTNDHFETANGKTVSGSGKSDRFAMRDRNPVQLAPVEPITMDEVQNSWKVSVDYQKQSAKSALEDITQKCGLTIFDQPDFVDTLAQEVTVSLKDVSPVEIIEAICSAVELHPRYKAGAMAVSKGPRTLPIAFAGPFVIEATETQELVPNAYGKIKFQAFAAGLPEAIASRLNGVYIQDSDDAQKATLAISALKGADGSNLDSRFRSFFPARASKSSVQIAGEVDVAGLLRAVTSIAEFDGNISWSFPQKMETVVLDILEKDATASVGDVTLTITRLNLSSQSSSITFDLEGATHKDLLITAYDSTGATCQNTYVSGYSNNDKHTAGVSARGKIAKLDVRVIRESDRVTFPFRFPSIPLRYYEDMPEVLPELTIDGDVPIDIEFTKFIEQNNVRSAKFRWTNKTNKDIHMVLLNVEYVDADGKVLQSRESRPSGNRIMLDYGESEETVVFGQSVPEGATSGTATLKSIEFVDGTEWNASEK